MSTRSPLNKRNQPAAEDAKKAGMSRRSAASAKPARAAASSVHVVPSSAKAKRKQAERGESLAGLSREEKRARKAELRRQEDRVYTASNALMKENPDYAPRRRMFYILMGIGIALLVVAWVLMGLWGNNGSDFERGAQFWIVVLAYVPVIGAFVYDMVRIRPIRNEARAQAEGLSESRLNAVIERSAAAEDRRRMEKEAARDAKRAARKSKSGK